MPYIPPTFIQEAETAWNTAPVSITTASFNVLAGDVLVAFAVSEGDNGGPHSIAGGSLTWNKEKFIDVVNYTAVDIWTATVDSNKSMTVTFSPNVSGGMFGGNVLTFRGSDGVGASASTNVASGAPSLDLPTGQSNSAIVVANGDWTANTGARTWRTVNSITPSAGGGDEVSYFANGSNYGVYGAYYSDAGTAGTCTVGLTAPLAQKYAIVAVEVKGTLAPVTFPFNATVLDNFDRANTSSLGGSISSSGNIWAPTKVESSTATGLGITSNQLYYSASNGSNGYLNAVFGPDSEVYIDVPTLVGNGQYIALYARIQTPGSAAVDMYSLTYTHATVGNASWLLRRYDDGTPTTLSTTSAAAISAGDTIGLSVSGTGSTVTLNAYRKNGGNWSNIASVDDTSGSRITAAGYLGVDIDSAATSARFDNLSGGTYPSSTNAPIAWLRV